MKQVIFNGVKFTKDEKTGYYLNSTIRKRLHRYIWEFYKGKIKKGYQIHNIDFNKDNNDISNLIMLTKKQHLKIHSDNLSQEEREKRKINLIKNAIPEATKWHCSNSGKQWHKEQYKKTLGILQPKEHKCEYCKNKFMSKGANAKFCSNKCKSAYRRNLGIDNVDRECETCGQRFTINKYSKRKRCESCKTN